MPYRFRGANEVAVADITGPETGVFWLRDGKDQRSPGIQAQG